MDKVKESNTFLYTLTFFCAIGGFLFGYDTGVVSGAMLIITEDFDLDSIWQELIVSITVGFAAIFSVLAGYASNKFGRKPVTIIAAALFALGSIVLAAAWNKEALLIGP